MFKWEAQLLKLRISISLSKKASFILCTEIFNALRKKVFTASYLIFTILKYLIYLLNIII